MHPNRDSMQPILSQYHILRTNLIHVLPNWQAYHKINFIFSTPITKIPLNIKINPKQLQLWKETNQQLKNFITPKEGKPKMYQLLMNIHQLLFTLSKRLGNLITSEHGDQKMTVQSLKSEINNVIQEVVKLSGKKSEGTEQKERKERKSKNNKQEEKQIIRKSRLSAAVSHENMKLARQSVTNPSRNLSKMQSFMQQSESLPLETFTPHAQCQRSVISWSGLHSTTFSKSSKMQHPFNILTKSSKKIMKKQLKKPKMQKKTQKISIFPETACISKQLLAEEKIIEPITVIPTELPFGFGKQQPNRQARQRHPSIHQKCENKVKFAMDLGFESCFDIDANNLSNVTKAQINTRKGIVILEPIEVPKSLEQIDICSINEPITKKKQIKIKPNLHNPRSKGDPGLLMKAKNRFQSKTAQCLRHSQKKSDPFDEQKDRWDTYAEICFENGGRIRQTNRQNDLCIPEGDQIQSAFKELERFSLDLKEVCRQPKCQQSVFFKQQEKIQASESRQIQYRLSAFQKLKSVRNEIFEIRSQVVQNKDLLYSEVNRLFSFQLDDEWIQQKYACPPGLQQIQLK